MKDNVMLGRGKQRVLENNTVLETHPMVQLVLRGCRVYSENEVSGGARMHLCL